LNFLHFRNWNIACVCNFYKGVIIQGKLIPYKLDQQVIN
jgi:hypothetical protein